MKCSKCGKGYARECSPNCDAKAEVKGHNQILADNQTRAILQSTDSVTSQKAKTNKKVYKKGQLLVLTAIIAVVIALVGCNNGKGEEINWNDIVMGDVIPQPESEIAQIYGNSDESLSIYIYKTSSSDYTEYIKKCEEKGFTVDEDKNFDSFETYNTEGYKLKVQFRDYKDTYMIIDLDAPIEMKAIQWPSSAVGNLLPVPKSLYGNFSYEREESFHVYIGNTTADDYTEYVTVCSDSGFNVDYNKGDKYYYADNREGYHISLIYEGNNIMNVSIKSPDKSDETSSTEKAESGSGPDASSGTVTEQPQNEPDYSEETDTTETTQSTDDSDEIGIEFKAAMDSYEAFYDEYCAFIKKYNANKSDLSLLTDYASFALKYSDINSKLESWKNKDLNNEELKYYLEVNNRIAQKLLEISEDEANTNTESTKTEEPEEKTEEPEEKTESSDGLGVEFKAAMDSYEAFYDEYCAFMKKYNANKSDLSLLSDYASLSLKSYDVNLKFEEWKDTDLNDEEMRYYLEVSSRVLQKLSEVSG